MAVPKTSMNKQSKSVPRKYKIWLPRQVLSVKTVPKAQSVSRVANSHLRRRVARADAGHHFTSPSMIDDIHYTHPPAWSWLLWFQPSNRGVITTEAVAQLSEPCLKWTPAASSAVLTRRIVSARTGAPASILATVFRPTDASCVSLSTQGGTSHPDLHRNTREGIVTFIHFTCQ
jgi:hypothetical protein